MAFSCARYLQTAKFYHRGGEEFINMGEDHT
jgi:hypothetical protein